MQYFIKRVLDVKCKEYLDKGFAVLFSGTPCQIRGLKNFLRKEYEKLLTVDLICHGVPSPLVWKHYISIKQKEFSTTISDASFRDKGQGWNDFRLNLYSNECVLQAKGHDTDPYMRLFLSNVILRPSCYSCHFREGKSGSDITLADFWGIEKVVPEMNDDKGFSLVLINTPIGSDVFETVKPEIEFLTVSHKDAIKYNSSWYSSVPLNPNRNKFFRLFKFWRNYERRVETLLKPRKSLRNALRRKFRCIIQKAKNFNYRY